MLHNALLTDGWQRKVETPGVFKILMGDGNPENIHVLKTSCNNLSETKSIREHSESTVSPLGSTLFWFDFKLSLISPQHSLHRWIEKRKTERSFRCLHRKKKKVSGTRAGALYRAQCIFRSTKKKRSVILALGSAWEGSFNAGQRDYHIDPSRLTRGARLLFFFSFSFFSSLRVLRRCALIDRHWTKILIVTPRLGIETEKMGTCFATQLKMQSAI